MKRFVLVSLLLFSLSTLALAQRPAGTIEGTTWTGTVRAPDSTGEFHDYDYQFDFLPGNRVRWKWSGQFFTNGTWQQTGRAIRMELNDGYSTWLGTLDGRRMSGNSVNRLGHKWDWVLVQQAASDSSGPVGPVPLGSKPATGGWIKYSSERGRFSVVMPTQPSPRDQPIDSAAGPTVNHVFMSVKGSAAFAVSYADYPQASDSADPQVVLDNVRQGALNGIKGTLVSSRRIMHKGYPGREFQASTKGALYTSRIYLVGNRLYQLVVVAPVGALSDTEINRFLTSFDLQMEEQ